MLKTKLACLSLLISSMVIAQESTCQWPQSVSIDEPTTDPTTRTYDFASPVDGLLTITETTVINQTALQASFGARVTSSPGWSDLESKQSCENRFGVASFTLEPSPPNAIGTIKMGVQKYWCAPHSIPCGTLQYPGRTCTSSGFLAGGDADAQITVSLAPGKIYPPATDDNSPPPPPRDAIDTTQGVPQVTLTQSVWQQVIIDQMGAALTAFGPILIEVMQKIGIEDLENQAAGQIANAVNQPPNPVDDGNYPLYYPHLKTVQFVDLGNGVLGTQFMREAAPMREGSACFMLGVLKAQHAQQAAADPGNLIVQKLKQAQHDALCAAFKDLGQKTCPF